MAPILTAENLVLRIASDCASVDERGAFGIRPEPAAAILRRRGEQCRRAPRHELMWRSAELPSSARMVWKTQALCATVRAK